MNNVTKSNIFIVKTLDDYTVHAVLCCYSLLHAFNKLLSGNNTKYFISWLQADLPAFSATAGPKSTTPIYSTCQGETPNYSSKISSTAKVGAILKLKL